LYERFFELERAVSRRRQNRHQSNSSTDPFIFRCRSLEPLYRFVRVRCGNLIWKSRVNIELSLDFEF
jgi:hypothetical protein